MTCGWCFGEHFFAETRLQHFRDAFCQRQTRDGRIAWPGHKRMHRALQAEHQPHGATLHLRKGKKRRSLPLEDFFLDYGKQDRAPGELVEGITLPLPAPGSVFRAYKVSKRFDQDITAVLGAFNLKIEGGVVTEARLAYGGLAGIPKRAPAAEAALTGQPWTEEVLVRAMAALAEDFQPLTDWRAGAAYRLKAAQNLLRRCFIETTQPQTATRLVGVGAFTG